MIWNESTVHNRGTIAGFAWSEEGSTNVPSSIASVSGQIPAELLSEVSIVHYRYTGPFGGGTCEAKGSHGGNCVLGYDSV
jgi:hypothetical protein